MQTAIEERDDATIDLENQTKLQQKMNWTQQKLKKEI